jgi:hypothetical protein
MPRLSHAYAEQAKRTPITRLIKPFRYVRNKSIGVTEASRIPI